jgi:hypothetical protein
MHGDDDDNDIIIIIIIIIIIPLNIKKKVASRDCLLLQVSHHEYVHPVPFILSIRTGLSHRKPPSAGTSQHSCLLRDTTYVGINARATHVPEW